MVSSLVAKFPGGEVTGYLKMGSNLKGNETCNSSLYIFLK